MSDAPKSPKVPGRGPVIRRFDDPDVPWQRVKAQRNADGTEAAVWEKWFAFSAEPGTPAFELPNRVPDEVAVERQERVMDLQRRLKATFDPQGILNPGRMYAGV